MKETGLQANIQRSQGRWGKHKLGNESICVLILPSVGKTQSVESTAPGGRGPVKNQRWRHNSPFRSDLPGVDRDSWTSLAVLRLPLENSSFLFTLQVLNPDRHSVHKPLPHSLFSRKNTFYLP